MNRAYTIIAGALGIAAVVCVFIILAAPDSARLEIGIELAKAAIGLFPAVFFGVVVAELIKRRDDERLRSEKLLAARRAFRERSITAYNQSKSVRRYLRGAGFGPAMGSHISPEMLETLDQQMRRLSDAQLQLEQLYREVQTSDAEFADEEAVRSPLGRIEKSLNAVVRDWEHQRVALGERPEAASIEGWAHFVDFVADADKKVLPDNPTRAFAEFERVVLAQVARS